LKLVIQKDPPAPPVQNDIGIGFLEVFLALVAALIVAPYVQKQTNTWFGNINAIEFVRRNGIVISTYLVVFSVGWIVFMIVLPQLNMLDFSFRYSLPPTGQRRDVELAAFAGVLQNHRRQHYRHGVEFLDVLSSRLLYGAVGIG
jgi:hypothetical protein